MAHWFTQLIALSDGIVRVSVPNGRSVAVSSHFDFGSILHEINAMEQNTVGSMPNEAIAEENESEEKHNREGTQPLFTIKSLQLIERQLFTIPAIQNRIGTFSSMSLNPWLIALFYIFTLSSHLATNRSKHTLVFSTILHKREGRTPVSSNPEWFLFTPSHTLCR